MHFPVFVLSKLFGGKFLALLDRAVERGEISLGNGDEPDELERQAFALLKDKLYRKKWVAYAKKPFAGPKQVFRYLGLYTSDGTPVLHNPLAKLRVSNE